MARPRYSHGRPGPIRVLVLHATAGASPGDLNWLTQGGSALRPVSCHYYVSKSGRIVQLVRDSDTAWHCGAASWVVDGKRLEGSVTYAGGTVSALNAVSVGIELSNDNSGQDPYLDAQLEAAARLARYLVATYRIPREQVVRHRDISPGRKTDPAPPAFPWEGWLATVLPSTPVIVTTPESPILGPASGTTESAIVYLASRSTQYHDGAVAEIVEAYRREGAAAGVDWFLALAQLAHETGALSSWWCGRPRRNPAGIGVTGETRPGHLAAPGPDWAHDGQLWRRGLSFERWDPDSVRAHLGRLLAYALPAGYGTEAQRALIDEALALRPLPDLLRGSAATLRGLNGRWASPGTEYAQRVAATANRMREGDG